MQVSFWHNVKLSVARNLSRKFSNVIPTPTTDVIHDYSRDRRLTTLEIQHLRRKGKRICMLTAYDYPTAKHAESVGIEMLLVGDSLGMVVLGYDTTQPVTMDDMIHHSKAVRRGAPSRFIVGDMPFGSYESGPDEALKNAFRFIKEAQVDAVKLEGGRSRLKTVEKLVDSGIAVMGHIGLTPQATGVLGGFRAQGRTAIKARAIVDDAIALEKAGAFALVIECVPAVVAKAVTDALNIPVIGIGAGPYTNGQVLVYHDLLGVMHHPHHEKHVPSFCKRYAKLGADIHKALLEYRNEVHNGQFPSIEYSPYKMSAEEHAKFIELLTTDANERSEESVQIGKKIRDADEYEIVKLY
eukprot:gene11349-15216_t